jgi:hypothetical protein
MKPTGTQQKRKSLGRLMSTPTNQRRGGYMTADRKKAGELFDRMIGKGKANG